MLALDLRASTGVLIEENSFSIRPMMFTIDFYGEV
jgi:hypothetical protein